MLSLLYPAVLWIIYGAIGFVFGVIYDMAIPLGFLVLLLPVVAIFTGIHLGILALKEIDESEKLKGKSLAILGVTIWYVLFAIHIIQGV
jgi:uncharacterized membrane protein